MSTAEWEEEIYHRVHCMNSEAERLAMLTSSALVREAVEQGLTDNLLVEEMCSRLDPFWADRDDPALPWPLSQRLEGEA